MTPESIVKDVLSFGMPKAAPKLIRQGNELRIEYNINTWAVLDKSKMKWSFHDHVSDMVSKIFEKFPDIETINVSAIATLVDMRGNETKEQVLGAGFTRRNAATINWKNVKPDNIPLLANSYYEHPSMLRKK